MKNKKISNPFIRSSNDKLLVINKINLIIEEILKSDFIVLFSLLWRSSIFLS